MIVAERNMIAYDHRNLQHVLDVGYSGNILVLRQ